MRKKPKKKLTSIAHIRKALYQDWSARVKEADRHECVLCGNTDNLHAHHWYCCDNKAHAARYAVDNGVTLCYACHIRKVHTRADFVTIRKLAIYMTLTREIDEEALDKLIETEITVPYLRQLFAEFRKRVILVTKPEGEMLVGKRKPYKTFFTTDHRFIRYQIFNYNGVDYEVKVVSKDIETGIYRYTVEKYNPELEGGD